MQVYTHRRGNGLRPYILSCFFGYTGQVLGFRVATLGIVVNTKIVVFAHFNQENSLSRMLR